VQDSTGVPVRGYDDYDPWGYIMGGRTMTNGILPTATRNRFTGKEFDDEFNLNWNYFGARYYDAQIGRWMVRDPLAGKYPGWSPYIYTLNNPMSNIDPNGKDTYRAGLGAIGQLSISGLSGQVGIAFDDQWGLAVTLTVGGTPATGLGFGGSAGGFLEYTNAPSVSNLSGLSFAFGAWLGDLTFGQIEGVAIPNPSGGFYLGGSLSGGVGIGAGVYGVAEYTWVAQTNIKTVGLLTYHALKGDATLTIDEKGQLIVVTNDGKVIETGVQFELPEDLNKFLEEKAAEEAREKEEEKKRAEEEKQKE
jgi:RHS repeat-associated protein